ncbi:YidC/Oxa1 family membrane protein insertase [Pseudobutyrivibrio xylanivorans]|uniref:YidC/Oxa1 family membrane protein insertase n=1 Tax=Pseudobutyrivibrio xylanivorans DSM 14809 TaxID=1123012 RepID=A0A1M6ISA6_PSEXY|nr:YidC/Oxa1 family membrane protein insertase [Pseudobutyrivibrio xylanivorans]SHJ37288.1 YidC/Oxa1 family membrane protein insertase [Pseudobutyrivibrio xylanivorans DSM 14809]
MSELLLTAYDGSILGPIAKVLGWFMDKIYILLASIGIENIALTIVIFTIFIYLCMFPLTYKQQKFAVLTRKMQPEMKAIQDKYKGKKDQASMQAQQSETQALYDKYGISPTGSCVYMLIQMPILFALYRVFYNVPAYISSVKNVFTELVNGIMATDGFATTMQNIFDESGVKNLRPTFTGSDTTVISDSIIDVLYKLPSAGWEAVTSNFPALASSVDTVVAKLEKINYLFVLNISDTPLNLIKDGWSADTKNFGLIICALLIPVCSYLSQMANIKLTPTSTEGQSEQMAQQMKTMNLMMPLMSLFICFSVPVGLGLYWIAGAVVRIIQQYFLNKHFEKIDLESIIEKNKEKAAAKAEKRGIRQAQIYEAARMSTKIDSMYSKTSVESDDADALKKADEFRSKASSGSLASKANLVKEFNEMNNK